MRFFSRFPGDIGKGARELQAVSDAIAKGELSDLRWTLVRAGVNAHGKDETAVASLEFDK